MACPALPTCAQALGEAERILPELTDMLDGLLRQRRLGKVRIETRVTGCPNGCARPYVAELGIVGRTKRDYDVYVGGDAAGTRLAVPVVESVPLAKLDSVLGPLLDGYKATRKRAEGFGDWAVRTGIDTVGPDSPVLPPLPRRRRMTPHTTTAPASLIDLAVAAPPLRRWWPTLSPPGPRPRRPTPWPGRWRRSGPT